MWSIWLREHNEERVRRGKYCYGKTPMRTFLDALPMTRGKMLGETVQACLPDVGPAEALTA